MKHIIDDLDKNKYEAYTKQETLAAIQEAISSGELPEEINGLVITLKNPIDNEGYKIAFCTQAKYNELEQGGQLEVNCYYYITDDSTFDDWNTIITNLQTDFEELRQEVEEAIETGMRYRLTSIECACNFEAWNGRSDGYSSGDLIPYLCLKNRPYGTITTPNEVNILPAGSNSSIAEARVDYVSGDDGYISYSLDAIQTDQSSISFVATATNRIYAPSSSGGISRSTTFKIYIKDIYNNEFTKEFTINFKSVS